MKSKENIRFMKKNKNLQGCVSIERERERAKMEAVERGSKRDFGTVKVESGNCVVCNQGER